LGNKFDRQRKYIKGTQRYVYLFPGLEKCRKSFEKWFGHTIKW
jgi:hypothetical protein